MGAHRRKKEPLFREGNEYFFIGILFASIVFGLVLDAVDYEGLTTVPVSIRSPGDVNVGTLMFVLPFWLIETFNFKVATLKQRLICLVVIVVFLLLLLYTIFDCINYLF